MRSFLVGLGLWTLFLAAASFASNAAAVAVDAGSHHGRRHSASAAASRRHHDVNDDDGDDIGEAPQEEAATADAGEEVEETDDGAEAEQQQEVAPNEPSRTDDTTMGEVDSGNVADADEDQAEVDSDGSSQAEAVESDAEDQVEHAKLHAYLRTGRRHRPANADRRKTRRRVPATSSENLASFGMYDFVHTPIGGGVRILSPAEAARASLQFNRDTAEREREAARNGGRQDVDGKVEDAEAVDSAAPGGDENNEAGFDRGFGFGADGESDA